MGKLKVLIFGPIAPPIGGISIHIDRLKNLLENEFIFDFIDESKIIKENIYNIRSKNLFKYLIKILHADILYIQSGNIIYRYIHIIFGNLFKKKIILTIHGFGNFKYNIINRWMNHCCDKIIIVNKNIVPAKQLNKIKIFVKPAFIMPVIANEPILPNEIENIIITARNEYNKIIISNASKLRMFNNEDLYGLDLCLQLSSILKENEFKFIFIFIVSSQEEHESYFKKIKNEIKINRLEKNFYLIPTLLSFSKLISKSDLVIRATNIDGDSISVREAICLNTPVIASDAVERPIGTIVFKNRNLDDLYSKTTAILKKQTSNKELNIYKKRDENDFDFYKNLIIQTATIK